MFCDLMREEYVQWWNIGGHHADDPMYHQRTILKGWIHNMIDNFPDEESWRAPLRRSRKLRAPMMDMVMWDHGVPQNKKLSQCNIWLCGYMLPYYHDWHYGNVPHPLFDDYLIRTCIDHLARFANEWQS